VSTAAASNPMGLKRICTNCGARFYDMNNRPIICPSCDTEFTGEVKLKSRRGRTPAVEKKADTAAVKEAEKKTVDESDDDDLEEEDDGVEVVSLDDVDEKPKVADSDDDNSDDDDDLDDIPDFDDPIVDELGTDDDDTLLDEDDDD